MAKRYFEDFKVGDSFKGGSIDVDACAKATVEAEFTDSMKKQGTRVAYLDAKQYAVFLDKIDAENKTIMTDLGLIKK